MGGVKKIFLAALLAAIGLSIPCLSHRGETSPVRRILVIPVEFSDLQFTYGADTLERFLNSSAFDLEGAKGSVAQYFADQFGDAIPLGFELAPVVKLSKPRAYYGQNNAAGVDSHPDEMVIEACRALDSELDFSLYDNDSTGTVQHLVIIYAGDDESLGAPEDRLWSQCWSLKDCSHTIRLDNTTIDVFACTSELGAEGGLSGIGRFCHETLHTFGLRDFYDTFIPKEKAYYSAALWKYTSIMDGGWANDNEHTPAGLNAVERDFLGIGHRIEFKGPSLTLTPICESGEYARLDCPEEGEYFLFECRSQSGWDRYIGTGGLLVYHIDRSSRTVDEYSGVKYSAKELWEHNLSNIFPLHQCVDLVEASGKEDRILRSSEIMPDDLADIAFPAGGSSLGPNTVPALKSWYSGSPGLSINKVALNSSCVTLFIGEESTAIKEIETFQDAAIVSWTCREQGECEVKIDGKTVQKGVKPISDSTFCTLIDGLEPAKSYSLSIVDSKGYTAGGKFTTNAYNPGSKPVILMSKFPKDDGNYIVKGSRAALRVGNAPGNTVLWYADGKRFSPSSDGKITVENSFTLKAEVFDSTSVRCVIIKEIKAR